MESSEIEAQLAEDPGNPLFAEYADRLRKQGSHSEAMEVCFRGLSANPTLKRGRLVLARVYYEKLYWPFAVREVEQLHKELPESETIKRLLEALAPERKGEGEAALSKEPAAREDSYEQADPVEDDEETVAEAEFELDAFDLLEEED